MKKFARAVLRPFEELDENHEVVGRDDESLGARNLDDVVKGIVAVDRPQEAREVEGRLAARGEQRTCDSGFRRKSRCQKSRKARKIRWTSCW
jgi:hypothetical protein